MAAVTICSDFGAPKIEVCHCFHCFPIYLPWSDGTRSMILVFWMLSFKTTFSLSSFTFICILRLLIFLPSILIPVYATSSPAFLMMYSAYKLNKQGDNIQPWHIPFPISNQSGSMSSSNCSFLTCIQISQEAGQVVWYSHPFQNFPVCCDPHSQRFWHSQ